MPGSPKKTAKKAAKKNMPPAQTAKVAEILLRMYREDQPLKVKRNGHIVTVKFTDLTGIEMGRIFGLRQDKIGRMLRDAGIRREGRNPVDVLPNGRFPQKFPTMGKQAQMDLIKKMLNTEMTVPQLRANHALLLGARENVKAKGSKIEQDIGAGKGNRRAKQKALKSNRQFELVLKNVIEGLYTEIVKKIKGPN
ncbi:MAG: hypothetical protein QGI60_04585 [archaeon]|jgi:hypothetical protein|nr:hypothetical protein [archaeon]